MNCLLELDHRDAISLSYSNNGDYLLTAGIDRHIKLWNSSTGRLIKVYSSNSCSETTSLKVSNDNTFFVSSSQDSAISLWDVSKGQIVTKLTSHKKKVNSLNWNYNDQLILSGSDDSTVKIWDFREKSPIETLNASKDSVFKVSSNSDQIVSGSVDGFLQTYDIRCGVIYIDNLKEVIVGMDFAKNCEIVGTVHYNGIVKVTDKSIGQVIKAFEHCLNPESLVLPCTFASDLKLICADVSGNLCIYEMGSNNMKKIKVSSETIRNLMAHPSLKEVVAVSLQDSVKIIQI